MATTDNLKAHLYRVVPSDDAEPLSDVLARINSFPIKRRIRLVNQRKHRLEGLEDGSTIDKSGAGLFLFNIMHFRQGHGPGQAQDTKPLQGLNFNGGGPGEDTAAIYDPDESCLIIQYNHNGPRNTAIRSYLAEFFHSGTIELNTVLDNDFKRKFQNQRHLTRVEAKVDVSQISKKDFQGNTALRKACEAAEDLGGETISITISVDGRKKGNQLVSKAKGFANDLMFKASNNPDAVTKLETKGPIGSDQSEIIDLLGGKLTGELEVAVSDADYRMDIKDRWEALYRIYASWKRKGLTK
ncbi:DUF6731 family protein [Vreelandella populi]|uniref:DUF6731 family protein n=1 Tax=Vreelandella populi TaxID=2498858 RepID=UPI000F8E4DD0|nr:DUF6731 family protein [Halomonas populi]RUR38555.1 hypothetical protein ELY25_09335 [Halomonas populi]